MKGFPGQPVWLSQQAPGSLRVPVSETRVESDERRLLMLAGGLHMYQCTHVHKHKHTNIYIDTCSKGSQERKQRQEMSSNWWCYKLRSPTLRLPSGYSRLWYFLFHLLFLRTVALCSPLFPSLLCSSLFPPFFLLLTPPLPFSPFFLPFIFWY